MAFGSSLKKTTQTAKEETKENKVFENQFVNDKAGKRVIRLLPAVDADGKIILDENGKSITEPEVRFADYWIEVKNSENPKGTMNLRVMVDWENLFDNVIWKHLSKMYKQGDKQRKRARQRFAINVFDKTPILFAPNGAVVYPNHDGDYIYEDSGKRTKLVGDVVPLNRIRVLEGSAGNPGGKHLLQNLVTTCDAVENAEGQIMLPHEYDIRYKITGEGIDTQRMFQLTSNYAPLNDAILALPRWNIAEWVTPWPDEAVLRLLAGQDFVEVSKDYTFIRFPRKYGVEEVVEEEENLFE